MNAWADLGRPRASVPLFRLIGHLQWCVARLLCQRPAAALSSSGGAQPRPPSQPQYGVHARSLMRLRCCMLCIGPQEEGSARSGRGQEGKNFARARVPPLSMQCLIATLSRAAPDPCSNAGRSPCQAGQPPLREEAQGLRWVSLAARGGSSGGSSSA